MKDENSSTLNVQPTYQILHSIVSKIYYVV